MKLSQRRLARPSLGGMLATRQGSLVLALLCAVCAAGILFFALNRYKTSLKPPVTQDTVLVATGTIAKGTPGSTVASEKLYRSAPVPVSQATPGALTDSAAIANEYAATDILPGQQLTAADFSAYTSVSETLAPDQRAISISVSEAPGATDIVQAGDHVDLYATSDLGTIAGHPGVSFTSPVVANVLVLKTGNATPVKDQGVPITGGTMEVVVPSAEAPLVIALATKNAIYLDLRPTKSDTTVADQFASGLTQLNTKGMNQMTNAINLAVKSTK